MDNLEELWCYSIKLNEKEWGKIVACSISEEIACFITDTNYLYVFEQNKLDNSELTIQITNDEIKDVHFLALHNAIFVASNQQLTVITRDLQNHNTQSIPSHIAQLAWNPDETLLVVISKSADIISYSYSKEYMFEIKSTTKLNANVSNSVCIGWGLQNTQFLRHKGRQRKENDLVKPVPIEYAAPTISWQTNGQQFVVNYYEDGQRYIKVFNSDLVPLNKSEKYLNLLEPVCMILGQCIACCAVGNDGNTIVIFEKNCKAKSCFEVAENKGKIRKIQCHPDMNLLAVYSLDKEGCGYINIYLYTNGKWKLKQQLYFPTNRKIHGFDFLSVHEPLYTLCRLVVFTSEDIEFHTFRFVVNRCPIAALAAVISGRSVDFFNFAEKNVPPPMKFCSVDHIRPVNRVLFHPQKLLCILLDSKLQAIVIDVEHFHKLIISNEIDLKSISCFHSVTWNENDRINIDIGNDCEQRMVIKESLDVTIQIRTAEKVSRGILLPYSDTTSLTSYKNVDDNFRKLFYLTKKVVNVNNEDIELEFSLSSSREFYVNDKKVCNDITSCLVFQNYLMLTSVECKLHCIRISQDYEQLCDKLDLTKAYSREIEQGARIVSFNNSYPPQITFQLPRGNLESIGCRLVAVDAVEELLSKGQWKVAVDLMRTERLNWNLLVDLNPERFSKHIEDFVTAAKYCSLLTNIVCEFNSTNNVYYSFLPDFTKVGCDKKQIVTRILEYLISSDSFSNFLSIVSIQHKHISLKSALKSIKLVFENSTSNTALCKRALHSILINEDIKEVLSTAYSLYHLGFVLFVYLNSSIDPKHYEPIIERLKKLSPIELRYEMALSGRDVRNAVKYILRYKDCSAVKLETFILKHELEEVAYNSLHQDCKHFELVAVLYAKKLSRRQSYAEAGLILKRIGLLSQALEQYKNALDWIEILGLLTSLEYEECQRTELLDDISNQLVKRHRIDEAVLILEHYNNDYKKAIEVLVDHNEFKKAIVLAKVYKATHILYQVVIPSLNLYVVDLKDTIEEHKGTFKTYVERLQVIRREKKSTLDAALGMYDGDDDLFFDSDSTITSLDSSRSKGSTFSPRNRRKENRKKIDLREGGYYEDIALIRAIHILYGTVFALGSEVREVCLILEHSDVKLCKNLHEELSQLQEIMIKRIPEVWSEVFVSEPERMDNTVMAVIQNKADLDPQYCVPPSKDVLNLNWKLEMYS